MAVPAIDELAALIPDVADKLGNVERRIITEALDALEEPTTIGRALGLSGRYLEGDLPTT